jgi:hypothetical protein
MVPPVLACSCGMVLRVPPQSAAALVASRRIGRRSDLSHNLLLGALRCCLDGQRRNQRGHVRNMRACVSSSSRRIGLCVSCERSWRPVHVLWARKLLQGWWLRPSIVLPIPQTKDDSLSDDAPIPIVASFSRPVHVSEALTKPLRERAYRSSESRPNPGPGELYRRPLRSFPAVLHTPKHSSASSPVPSDI